MFKRIGVIILFLIFIGGGVSIFWKRSSGLSFSNVSSSPIATPFLFQEITIPYLRERKYESTLGKLEEYSQTESYTSYLTSYSSDGLKINGFLTKPKGGMVPGGFPAVVFVHGYIAPPLYETAERYGDYVDYLARNGFVVFKIDLRGHGESEGEAGGAYYSADYVVDTLNAYAALSGSGFVNQNKIGLWGHSMGGNVVFRSYVVKKDIPVVIWAGAGYTYEDLVTYRIVDNSYRAPESGTERARLRKLLVDTYGSFSFDSPFWRQVVPTNFLEGVRGAIEVHHALDDQVVSSEYSRNLMRILEETNIAHQLFEYQTGGHNISGTAFGQAMSETVKFFKNEFN